MSSTIYTPPPPIIVTLIVLPGSAPVSDVKLAKTVKVEPYTTSTGVFVFNGPTTK
jgi:hypothetical protein